MRTLPPDERIKLRAVSKCWRALLDDAAAWADLDTNPATICRPTVRFVSSCALKAHGQLRSLKAYPVYGFSLLLSIVCSNKLLRDVSLLHPVNHSDAFTGPAADAPPGFSPDQVAALAAAASSATSFTLDGAGDSALSVWMLRRRPPFGALCLRSLVVIDSEAGGGGDASAPYDHPDTGVDALVELLTFGCAAARSLTALTINDAPLHVRRRFPTLASNLSGLPSLSRLDLTECRLPQSALSDLAPLVARQLTHLCVFGLGDDADVTPPLTRDAAAKLVAALQSATCKLEVLILSDVYLFDHVGAALSLLASLRRHPTLNRLHVDGNPVDEGDGRAVGAALAALVVPGRLTRLGVSACLLGDAGLGLIYDALPGQLVRC